MLQGEEEEESAAGPILKEEEAASQNGQAIGTQGMEGVCLFWLFVAHLRFCEMAAFSDTIRSNYSTHLGRLAVAFGFPEIWRGFRGQKGAKIGCEIFNFLVPPDKGRRTAGGVLEEIGVPLITIDGQETRRQVSAFFCPLHIHQQAA